MVGSPKQLSLEFSGWGRDIPPENQSDGRDIIDSFFGIDPRAQNRIKLREDGIR